MTQSCDDAVVYLLIIYVSTKLHHFRELAPKPFFDQVISTRGDGVKSVSVTYI